ncbi:MAG TPA: pyridoxal-phosphate dependent enzyme [Candidatus Paceibacterota bacterium]|nr:pyridoxal-phosphate dependent enzyme [Candidatus Paceibacterota bacterium]
MRKLDEVDRKAMRKHVLGIVENGLPPLKWMPIPSFVRSQPWFIESNAGENVLISALSAGDMEVGNGKLQPALKACLMDEEEGKFTPETIVVGNSSGNWAGQMALIAPIFPFKEFRPIIDTRSVPKGKIHHLEANGVREIIEVPEGSIGTDYAYEVARRPHHYLLDQYTHQGSKLGHKWTMDHIIRQLPSLIRQEHAHRYVWIGNNLSFAAAVTGTCSTVAAMDEFLRPAFPNMEVWAVASKSNKEKVPGSRSPEKIDELKSIGGGFNYQNAIDGGLITSVTLDEAYLVNAELAREYFVDVGPTGALGLAGVWNRIGEYWMKHGNFDGIRNDAGFVLGCIYTVDKRLPYLDDPGYRKYFQ